MKKKIWELSSWRAKTESCIRKLSIQMILWGRSWMSRESKCRWVDRWAGKVVVASQINHHCFMRSSRGYLVRRVKWAFLVIKKVKEQIWGCRLLISRIKMVCVICTPFKIPEWKEMGTRPWFRIWTRRRRLQIRRIRIVRLGGVCPQTKHSSAILAPLPVVRCQILIISKIRTKWTPPPKGWSIA